MIVSKYALIALSLCSATVTSFTLQQQQHYQFHSIASSQTQRSNRGVATVSLSNDNTDGSPQSLGAGGMADTRDPDAFEHEDARKSISAAPSFEDYLKMRSDTSGAATTTATPPPTTTETTTAVTSPPASAPAPTTTTTTARSGAASSSSVIATLEASQSSMVDKIAATIPDLAIKPDFTWTATDSSPTTIGPDQSIVTVDARDAPGPANIAWLAGLCVDSKLSSLTIFNGPLTDVPHLVSRCVYLPDTDELHLTIDFRPRCYGAYELRREDGTYPGPEELGRKSFEYSGARKEFDTKFGTDDVQSFLQSTISSLENVISKEYDPNPTELDFLTRGPLYTSILMSNTPHNVDTIRAAREQVVDYWLSWMQDDQHDHRPGAPVNTQYVYDTKFKQNAYGALLAEYQRLYGNDDGQKLAVGESGPLDEAYVGGGS